MQPALFPVAGGSEGPWHQSLESSVLDGSITFGKLQLHASLHFLPTGPAGHVFQLQENRLAHEAARLRTRLVETVVNRQTDPLGPALVAGGRQRRGGVGQGIGAFLSGHPE